MTKGRNSTLINRRNNMLILRYYYWYEVKRRRFDDVVTILSTDEFYLQPYTIRCIIRDNVELIKKLKKERPEPRRLEQYQWSAN